MLNSLEGVLPWGEQPEEPACLEGTLTLRCRCRNSVAGADFLRQRDLGEFSEATPRGKTFAELFAMERRARYMSLQCEVLPDRPEARQERLRY
jgi:hypothetical protein